MEVKPVSERSFTGNWEDTYLTLFPDLEPVQTQLGMGGSPGVLSTWWDYREIIEETPVDLVANWLVTDTKMYQIKVKYDSNGFCVSQTLDVLQLKNWTVIMMYKIIVIAMMVRRTALYILYSLHCIWRLACKMDGCQQPPLFWVAI